MTIVSKMFKVSNFEIIQFVILQALEAKNIYVGVKKNKKNLIVFFAIVSNGGSKFVTFSGHAYDLQLFFLTFSECRRTFFITSQSS